ncbi:MAG TPA: ATP-grasp domain-containing protein [Gaiellaceae bacterium]
MTGVLFTCVGQRVDIVKAFRQAGATTIAVDANPLAPALYLADHYALVPRVDETEYVVALRAVVDEHDVDLIVPLTDLDQVTLARSRAELGAVVLLPDAEIVERLGDKYLAHLLFEERGIATPPTWLPNGVPDDAAYPLLVKARHGFGSRHIYRAADPAQLGFFLGYTPVDSIVQACLRGEEFSVDVFCDLEGRCLNAIPRTMIESKGGESIKGMSIRDERLIELARDVAERLELVGPANIQCFREADGSHYLTDINTRFGGGFPLPLAAGGGYPELALALARGEHPEPRLGEFREGIVMTRFFSDLSLTPNGDGTLKPLAPAE